MEPLDNFSKYPPFPPKNRIVLGVGGVPEFFFGWNPIIFYPIIFLVGILLFLLLFKIPPFSTQKSHSAGGRGGPRFFFWLESYYFYYLGAQAKLQNPTTTPSGRISIEPERKGEEEKKIPFILATYVYACSQGQRTHSTQTISHKNNGHIIPMPEGIARTPFGPITK
jgi:hypothetical protein